MAYVVTRMLVVITRPVLVQHQQTLKRVSFGIKAGVTELFATKIVRVALTLDAPPFPSTEV